MKSNKGFTLIETLAMLVVLTIVGIVTIKYVGNTLSVGKNEAYDIMKNNIVSSSYDYLRECNNGILSCDLDWNNESTSFYVEQLKDSGYFKNLDSPIDNKYLGFCLKIHAIRNNGNIDISLVDDCY